MPDENPQIDPDARRANEERMNQDFNDRYSTGGPPPERLVREQGATQYQYMKDFSNLKAAQQQQLETERKILEIQRIQRRESDAYMRALQRTRRMKKDELKDELEHFNLLKDRKQAIKDIEAVEKGAANSAQRRRVEDLKVQAAQARALQDEIGIDAGTQIQAGPNATPADLIRQGRGGFAARMISKGGVRGYIGTQLAETSGALKGGLGVGSITALARANPYVTAAIGLGLTYRGFNDGQGLNIPYVGSVPFTDWQNQMASGQITGEGYRAGLSAKIRGFTMGMNPFDTITSQVANSIIDAVRSQGFRGEMERNFEDTIKGIYKDTGLPVEQIAALGEIYARTGRLDEFRHSMEDLDKIAKDTSQSVASVATQFQTLNDALVVRSGNTQTGRVGAIVSALGSIPGTTQSQKEQMANFMAQGGSLYTGLTGTAAGTNIGQRFFDRQLQTILPSLRQSLEVLPENQRKLQIANWIEAGMFPGITDVGAAEKLIFGGPKALASVPKRASLARIDRAFEAATTSERIKQADLLNRGIGFDDARRVPRSAYIAELEQRLRRDGLTHNQIQRVMEPLRDELRSPGQHRGSWHEAVQSAQGRAHTVAIQNPQRRELNIRLDSAETRRLLSGKNVKKQIGLDDAWNGAKSVGTAFANDLGF